MIDIHSHILPGLDDGSASLEESIEMARIASDSGTTAIVASPHASPEYHFDPEVVERAIVELQQAVGDGLRIIFGCDFHLQYDNIQDALRQPGKYTVNHRRYLLVEFSDMLIFPTTGEIFRGFMEAGIVPVITHPERNPLLRQRLGDLHRWAEEGALMQVTAQSYFGRFGRRAQAFTETLMNEGLVHVVASDAHDTRHRPPTLDTAYQLITRDYGEEVAEQLLVTAPAAIVNGETVDSRGLGEMRKRRKWYQIW